MQQEIPGNSRALYVLRLDFERSGGRLWPDPVLFVGYGLFNGVAQCVNRALFGQIGGRAGRSYFLFRIGRLIHRQTDDDGGRLIGFDPLRRFDPIHRRHIDIHHDHIRSEPLRQFDRFRSVARFTDERRDDHTPLRYSVSLAASWGGRPPAARGFPLVAGVLGPECDELMFLHVLAEPFQTGRQPLIT